MSNDTKGYLFPDDFNPGRDTYCFKVYVPKRREYLAAFWGAYMFFGEWIAWARDPLKRGKDVAAIWRNAIEQARLEFDLTGGECMANITGVRPNPLDECEIQIQYDGGDWVHGFNISDCKSVGGVSSGALRWDGEKLQQYDPCTGEWRDIGPVTDPAKEMTVPGKYPDTPCGNGVAAANIARMIEDGKNKMCTFMSEGASFAETALIVFDALTHLIVGLDIWDQAVLFLSAVWSWLGTHYADVAAFDLYEHLSPIIPAYFEPDGSMTQADYDNLIAKLTQLTNSYVPLTTENTAYGYALAWCTAAGKAGLVKATNGGNIGTFDCNDAHWFVVFEGAKLQEWWRPALHSSGAYCGHWDGSAWRENLIHETGTTSARRWLDLRLNLPSVNAFELLEAAVYYDLNLGVNVSSPEGREWTFYALDSSGFMAWDEVPPTTIGDNREKGFSGDVSGIYQLRLDALAGYDGADDGTHDPGGNARIRKVIFEGKGQNPFA